MCGRDKTWDSLRTRQLSADVSGQRSGCRAPTCRVEVCRAEPARRLSDISKSKQPRELINNQINHYLDNYQFIFLIAQKAKSEKQHV